MQKILFTLLNLALINELSAQIPTDAGQTVTLPIAFHIFYPQGLPNSKYHLTPEQIKSQVDSLNKDYMAQNADFAKLAIFDATYGTNFSSKAAGPSENGLNIKFGLAQSNLTPYPQPITGIFYVPYADNTPNDNVTNYDEQTPIQFQNNCINVIVHPDPKDNGISVRGNTFWGQNNLIYVRWNCIGSLDAGHPNVNPGFALDTDFKEGGILTHEIGHILGLFHPFDRHPSLPNDSPKSDFPIEYTNNTPGYPQDDTPTCLTNSGCQNFYNSGPNGSKAMHMNFMDYPCDPQIYMFTKAQKHLARKTLFTALSGLLTNTLALVSPCPPITNVVVQKNGPTSFSISWGTLFQAASTNTISKYVISISETANSLVQYTSAINSFSVNLNYGYTYTVSVKSVCQNLQEGYAAIANPGYHILNSDNCPGISGLALSNLGYSAATLTFTPPANQLPVIVKLKKYINPSFQPVETKTVQSGVSQVSFAINYQSNYYVEANVDCPGNSIDGSVSGVYFQSCINDANEPNNTYLTATALSFPVSVTKTISVAGSICPLGDQDIFSFTNNTVSPWSHNIKISMSGSHSSLEGILYKKTYTPSGRYTIDSVDYVANGDAANYNPCNGPLNDYFLKVRKKPGSTYNAWATFTAVITASATGVNPCFSLRIGNSNEEHKTDTSLIYEPELKIYPNPTSNILNIESETHKTTAKIELYDMQMRLIMVWENREDKKKTCINLSDLAEGPYILLITNASGERKIKKLTKN